MAGPAVACHLQIIKIPSEYFNFVSLKLLFFHFRLSQATSWLSDC